MPKDRALLSEGIAALGIETNQTQLLTYMALLQKWNKAINLTAITKEKDIVVKHLLDSLSILPLVQGNHIIDIGTGGGLPGIPLAISLPNTQFALCDSVGKKCVFLREAVRVLGLSNVEVVHSRIEAYKPAESFDMIVSRALALASTIVSQSAHLLRSGGHWLLMKGELEKQELEQIPYAYRCQALTVPYLAAQRHAIIVDYNKNT